MMRTDIERWLFVLAACGCVTMVRADCPVPQHVWVLELERVQVVEGSGSAILESEALGATATLHGGTHRRGAGESPYVSLSGPGSAPEHAWRLDLIKEGE